MIVNQASLKGLDIAYSTAFNQAFAGVKDTHDKFATTVPSSTGETKYTWLGQMPSMREWIGERTIQNLAASSPCAANTVEYCPYWSSSIAFLGIEMVDSKFLFLIL